MSEYRLRVGNAVLSLNFENDRESRALGRYFSRPSSSDAPDLSLAIRYRNDVDGSFQVPNSLFLTKKGDGKGFSTGDGLIEGRFSPDSGEGELVVQRLITHSGYARVYEQIFYQAYWSAIMRKKTDSFLLHSSGVIHKGLGYAFTGQSGSGKSTVANLCVHDQVLNDEIMVIDLDGTVPMLRDTPFNGYFRKKKEGSAVLSAIMLLKQAPHHAITRTQAVEDLKTLAREIIPPMGLETALNPGLYMAMMDCAQRTRTTVPLYRMDFLPDTGFWNRIDHFNGEQNNE